MSIDGCAESSRTESDKVIKGLWAMRTEEDTIAPETPEIRSTAGGEEEGALCWMG